MILTKKYKYIIIDDHELIRIGIRNVLQHFPQYELIGEYEESKPLLSFYKYEIPDFILLDINIPGTDGKASAVILKKNFPDCKIIALTQYSGIQRSLAKLGFDGYVPKGSSGILVNAIESVLNGRPYFWEPAEMEAPKPQALEGIDKYIHMSERERQVAWYIADGHSNPHVAELLFLSEHTVKSHRKNIYKKLDVKGATGVLKFLQKHNIARPDSAK